MFCVKIIILIGRHPHVSQPGQSVSERTSQKSLKNSTVFLSACLVPYCLLVWRESSRSKVWLLEEIITITRARILLNVWSHITNSSRALTFYRYLSIDRPSSSRKQTLISDKPTNTTTYYSRGRRYPKCVCLSPATICLLQDDLILWIFLQHLCCAIFWIFVPPCCDFRVFSHYRHDICFLGFAH